jgi:hypothetical protein
MRSISVRMSKHALHSSLIDRHFPIPILHRPPCHRVFLEASHRYTALILSPINAPLPLLRQLAQSRPQLTHELPGLGCLSRSAGPVAVLAGARDPFPGTPAEGHDEPSAAAPIQQYNGVEGLGAGGVEESKADEGLLGSWEDGQWGVGEEV